MLEGKTSLLRWNQFDPILGWQLSRSQRAVCYWRRCTHTSNGVENDGHVENLRLAPLMSDLLLEDLLLFIGEVVHSGNLSRVLSSQSTLLEEREDVVEIIVRSELLCRPHQSVARHTDERVANPWNGQSGRHA